MALTKLVNGVRVAVDPAEETDILAEWAQKDPQTAANKRKLKIQRLQELLEKKQNIVIRLNRGLGLLIEALTIIAKNTTIANPSDQARLVAIRNKISTYIDLEDFVKTKEDELAIDPDTDVESGWPV